MNQQHQQFNDELRERTLQMSVDVFGRIKSKKIQIIERSMVQQLLRCSSSVAANFRSATRARSDGEYYAKICIVVEECDETQFWIEYLSRVGFWENDKESLRVHNEVDQLVRLFASIKKSMKNKIDNKD